MFSGMFCVVRALVNCLIFEVIISGWYAQIIKPNWALSSLRSQGILSRPSEFEAFIHIYLFIYLLFLHSITWRVRYSNWQVTNVMSESVAVNNKFLLVKNYSNRRSIHSSVRIRWQRRCRKEQQSEGSRCMYLVLLFEALLKNSNEEST